jgi:hypothetical protein
MHSLLNNDGINEEFFIDNIDDTICYPDNIVGDFTNRWGVLALLKRKIQQHN